MKLVIPCDRPGDVLEVTALSAIPPYRGKVLLSIYRTMPEGEQRSGSVVITIDQLRSLTAFAEQRLA